MAPEPPHLRVGELRTGMRIKDGDSRALVVSAVVLATVSVVAVLYFAQTLFIPITLACILALVLAPVVRLLESLGLPRAPAAGLIVATALFVVVLILVRISTPASEWFGRLPEALYRLRYAFHEVFGALEEMREISRDIGRLSAGESGNGAPAQGPDLTQIFLSNTGQLLGILAIATILLYFLLANGNLFLLKTVHLLPRLSDKKRAVEIGRDLQMEVSRYLLTITIINLALGCATAAAMVAFGLPDPLLWGVTAAMLNFIPYVGPILTSVAIFLASVLTLTAPVEAIFPPLAYIALTTLEGNLITPTLVGRRLTINPVIVFGSLFLWGWLWGVAGLLLAVPLLVVFKILCDHIEPLRGFGEYLSSLPPEMDASERTVEKG